MDITFGQIVTAISAAMVVISFITIIYNFVRKSTLDKIEKNEKEIEQLKIEVGVLKSEAKDSKEERLLLVNGVLACLKGLQVLQGQSDDSAVLEGIQKIEDFLMKKSHN